MVRSLIRVSAARFAAVLLTAAGAAYAQPDVGPGRPGEEDAQPVDTSKPVWSDPALEAFAAKISGRWVSEETAGGDLAARGKLHLAITPMRTEGPRGQSKSDTLYYELAGVDDLKNPLSSGLLQLNKVDGGVVVRRYVLVYEVLESILSTVWCVPFEHRMRCDPTWLEPVLDMELEPLGNGYRSAGVAAGPVEAEQAGMDRIEMSLSIEEGARPEDSRLELLDRHVDFQSGVVLSSTGGFPWTFKRTADLEPAFSTDEGLVVYDPIAGTGEVLAENGFVHMDYTGWAAQSVQPIMTSMVPGREGFTTRVPYSEPGTGMIEGLSTGLLGVREGARRWIVIPPALGYGDEPQRAVPAGAYVIYMLDIASVMEPQAQEPAEEAGAGESDGGMGS